MKQQPDTSSTRGECFNQDVPSVAQLSSEIEMEERMKFFTAMTVIAVLTISSGLWARGNPKGSLAFNGKEAAKIHCFIKKTNLGPWGLTVTAENSSKHRIFDFLYSVHPSMKGAMTDCKAWMKAAEKKIKAEKKTKVSHGPNQSEGQSATR